MHRDAADERCPSGSAPLPGYRCTSGRQRDPSNRPKVHLVIFGSIRRQLRRVGWVWLVYRIATGLDAPRGQPVASPVQPKSTYQEMAEGPAR